MNIKVPRSVMTVDRGIRLFTYTFHNLEFE